MARIQNPIIGQAVNQAGGMVFSLWKTLKVMRAKPLSVANPRTTGQTAQRNRMVLFAQLFREILQTIRVGYVRYQTGTTQWAQFVKDNLMSATSVSGTTASLIPANMQFSKGSLLPVADLVIDSITGQNIEVTWTDNSGTPGAATTDKVYIVVVNANGQAVAALDPNKTRTAGSAIAVCPVDITAATALVYLFFANVAGDDVSDSQQAEA